MAHSKPLPSGKGATIMERDTAIKELCEICGCQNDGRDPLKIVLIGKHCEIHCYKSLSQGSGKSSFIDSLAAAISGERWREYATAARRVNADAITITNRRYKRCCSEGRYKEFLLPDLIDMPGLVDESGSAVTEMLKLLLYSHIKEGASIIEVYNNCRRFSRTELLNGYRTCYWNMRVDRVIFVASANAELPLNLMDVVYKACHPGFDAPRKREVPLFCVMTHKDEVNVEDSSFREKKEEVKLKLGLNEPRILVCSNYCDELDPKGERVRKLQPELDVPILRFMREVCDPTREGPFHYERLPVTEPGCVCL